MTHYRKGSDHQNTTDFSLQIIKAEDNRMDQHRMWGEVNHEFKASKRPLKNTEEIKASSEELLEN